MPLPSKRDRVDLRRRLTSWLAGRLPSGADPQVGDVAVPEGTGMSSETLLFDATWTEQGASRSGRFVARMAPDMDDYPVFPSYDLELQHRCLNLVAAHSDVPVPEAPWLELDETPLGSPFFVMSRVDGVAPSDLPPYPLTGWLFDATAEERARLQLGAVDVLARLHAIDVRGDDAAFLDRPQWGDTALTQHLAYQRWFYDWARDGVDYPVIERTFTWLEKHRPTDEGPVALNWGDSRIGNVLWRDFEPVAVLDWEMAALGAPEADVAWMVFMHRFFHDIAQRYGQPGLPDLLQRDDVMRQYEERSGRPVQNFEFYEGFAALRFSIISLRTSARAIAYGDMPAPESPNDLILHRHLIEQILDGSYWP